MGWMGAWWILGLALIVFAVWAAARAFPGRGDVAHAAASPPSVAPPRETAEETLRRRYASGELDRETFLRMREDLRH